VVGVGGPSGLPRSCLSHRAAVRGPAGGQAFRLCEFLQRSVRQPSQVARLASAAALWELLEFCRLRWSAEYVTKASTITLGTGRELRLCDLTQKLTNEGLLEGVPTTSMNKRHMDALVAEQQAKGHAVYLVAPVETPIDLGGGATIGHGSPASLPSVSCVGRFRSDPIGGALDYSELTIVWFQSDFALPIGPSVLEQITRLDWDALALDSSDW